MTFYNILLENRISVDLLDKIFNYKIIGDLLLVQALSWLLSFGLIFQIVKYRSVNYLIYFFIYINVNRFFINYGIVDNDLYLLILNFDLLVFIYLVYFFRTEMLLLKQSSHKFSEKIVDITYGPLVKKFRVLNYYYFFRNGILFILDNIINFRDPFKEKIKVFVLMFIIIIMMRFVGSYETLFLTSFLSIIISRQKTNYRTNTVYRDNFNNNVKVFNSLVSKTEFRSPQRHFLAKRASGFSNKALQAAENPKVVAGAVGVVGFVFSIDLAFTAHANHIASKNFDIKMKAYLDDTAPHKAENATNISAYNKRVSYINSLDPKIRPAPPVHPILYDIPEPPQPPEIIRPYFYSFLDDYKKNGKRN